jgi:hypothetical protein
MRAALAPPNVQPVPGGVIEPKTGARLVDYRPLQDPAVPTRE